MRAVSNGSKMRNNFSCCRKHPWLSFKMRNQSEIQKANLYFPEDLTDMEQNSQNSSHMKNFTL